MRGLRLPQTDTNGAICPTDRRNERTCRRSLHGVDSMKTQSIKRIVKSILKYHPQTREDDRALYQFYLIFLHKDEIVETNLFNINVIMKAPNMDTLGRARRRIQNIEGLYLPTPRTAAKRKENYQKLYKELSNDT